MNADMVWHVKGITMPGLETVIMVPFLIMPWFQRQMILETLLSAGTLPYFLTIITRFVREGSTNDKPNCNLLLAFEINASFASEHGNLPQCLTIDACFVREGCVSPASICIALPPKRSKLKGLEMCRCILEDLCTCTFTPAAVHLHLYTCIYRVVDVEVLSPTSNLHLCIYAVVSGHLRVDTGKL